MKFFLLIRVFNNFDSDQHITIKTYLFLLLTYMSVLPGCMHMPTRLVPTVGFRFPRTGVKQLWVDMWVMGTGSRPSAGAADTEQSPQDTQLVKLFYVLG